MDIFAEITGIKYQKIFTSELKLINDLEFDINLIPSNCLLSYSNNNLSFGICKWVSPKRTRSYPYERVYNILSSSKKISVIPVIKDEGIKGDRDFIQWDTISLMSLLDVYVILGYYDSATKHKTRQDKITNQKFNSGYINSKINEIKNYHSSALHWNLKEIRESLPSLIDNVKDSYQNISNELNVKLHDEKGIDKFQEIILKGLNNFMENFREKAHLAQTREKQTIQPKEVLNTLSKATITIKNYLGGLYFFTVDEVSIIDNKLYLIESKHSNNSKLPSLSDIKDGLLKMILYSNLENTKLNDNLIEQIPVLNLSSNKLLGLIDSSTHNQEEVNKFSHQHKLSNKQIDIIHTLFQEANTNNFIVKIGGI
ncbi:hypothetical protein [Cyanobacterium aponinum]|uniref:Uncharacterized protein n=1 Tax=Cyanobacterium aponinum 0216 TaxID=2676140 RepID=A0A844GQV5_9CHRO|nr:hypothetical protein [Cyanobacterium aponinum]MTF37432.1 hypothetical protein [Cyanobacterium aponinum 0216]